jgi:hypothetical protein
VASDGGVVKNSGELLRLIARNREVIGKSEKNKEVT